MIPPEAKRIAKKLEIHGDVREDPYYWLNDREDPEVIAYLEAENDYTQSAMAHTEDLQEELFEEIKGRIQQDDATVPYRYKDFEYYTRYEDGREYPIHCRRRLSGGDEEILLNVNELAAGHEFYAVGRWEVSASQNLLAYAADTQGRRIYTIHFKDLRTGESLPDVIRDVTGNFEWANDDRTVFYTRQDPQTLRSHRVFRHRLGSETDEDALVFDELDETFYCRVSKTTSEAFIVIGSYHTLSSEFRILDAAKPDEAFRVFQERERDHEYDIDHIRGTFYVRTNLAAKNFRLMQCDEAQTAKERWQEVIAHRDDVLLEGFELFDAHLVLAERRGGLTQIRVRPWQGDGEHYIEFDDPAYVAQPMDNHEPGTTVLRFGYESMTTPDSVYDYDMTTRERTLRKREKVLGGFDPDNYTSARLHATAADGTRIPISLVHRKDRPINGRGPLLLYGYGSYGHSIDPNFQSPRLSLLDRGFVFAIAHIRGGEELGRAWYESGKLLQKKNTFSDFCASAEHLINERYAGEKELFAIGGSAGGLLIGAAINMRPELFAGVQAAVPFVDVVTTMLDDTIPLTTFEYDEWGNPNVKEFYEYMLSYSPYDNVEAKDYPNILVTTGLHDSQVQYWEPAKWVARLRARKTDDHRLLLKTEMAAGHGGVSGRYKRYKETAFAYAFFLDLAAERR